MSREDVERALRAFERGEFVVVADDAGRENEGDLIARADRMTPEKMAFLVRHSSGLVCIAMTGERLDELGLPLMVTENTESHRTAFTVSVDYKFGTSTGISAADRSATIRALADADVSGEHFARPGHVFPLRAKSGGVLTRRGHTEAAVDLARLVGASPAGVLCEVVNDDGTMVRGRELREFAAKHALEFLTIEQLAAYRRSQESNNPAKFTELEGYDLKIVERVPLITPVTPENVHYLRAKQQRLGHELGLDAPARSPAAEEAAGQHALLHGVQA